jgi:LDH2 family malate/lactate/ureidoglycolate dehydrogenase
MTARTYGQWWNSTEPLVRVPIAELERIGQAAFEAVGASPADAAFLLGSTLDKSIQGDHARGVGHVPNIVALVRAGALDVAPNIEVVRERNATAVVDGGPRAHAQLVCRFGMDLAITKARQHGVGWVGARAWGQVLGVHVKQAVNAGLVGMSMVQTFPSVAPLGGYQPLLGNGPLAFGVPASERDPVILDMSTTESSLSGVFLAARQGQHIPPGLLLDEHGQPTTDAAAFPDREKMARLAEGPTAATPTPLAVKGTLLPMGGGHKGYALVFMVGLLSMLLTDTSPPWDLDYDRPDEWRYGTLLVAIDPGAFDPTGRVGEKVDAFIDRVTASPRIEGVDEILYPGQRSQALKRERRQAGSIEIPVSHLDGMRQLAFDTGVEPPRADGLDAL